MLLIRNGSKYQGPNSLDKNKKQRLYYASSNSIKDDWPK